MRIKYLQLLKKLNIPGVSGSGVTASNRISANGLDGSYNGMCKTIMPHGTGFILHVSGGPHLGFYEVPAYAVDHVGWELTLAEQHERGFITDERMSEIRMWALMPDADVYAAGVNRAMLDQIRKEFGPAPEAAPQTTAKQRRKASTGTTEA